MDIKTEIQTNRRVMLAIGMLLVSFIKMWLGHEMRCEYTDVHPKIKADTERWMLGIEAMNIAEVSDKTHQL